MQRKVGCESDGAKGAWQGHTKFSLLSLITLLLTIREFEALTLNRNAQILHCTNIGMFALQQLCFPIVKAYCFRISCFPNCTVNNSSRVISDIDKNRTIEIIIILLCTKCKLVHVIENNTALEDTCHKLMDYLLIVK